MKFKRLLLVSIFLLTILTIGVVSASENLTDSDVLDAADDVIVESEDSSDVLGDGLYYDDDFYIYVQENFTHGKRDWNSYDMVSIHSYSEKNSTIDILVDGVEKKSINATDGYFSIEIDENGTEHKIFSTFVYPNDLGMTLGSHNIKVNVNGNTRIDTPVSVNEMEDFTIWLQNPYYCEPEYWQSPSFMVIDSNNLNTGTLEIYVNGTCKLSFSVANGLFEEIENCSNKSRYVGASDLFDDYGKYNVQVKLTENGTTKILKDEDVVVAEFAKPSLNVYFDLYTLIIPADNVAHINLPSRATGNLTISYNDVHNKTVNYANGYGAYYIDSWDLNHLGENTITVTYTGDDYGTLTATETVLVLPDITCPYYVNTGEEFNISLLTFGWVNGEFNVYEDNAGSKGKLLGSSKINAYSYGSFAVATVNLTCEESGVNELYLDYYDLALGHYTIFRQVYAVKNSEKITANVPSEAELGSEFNVTLNAPDVEYTAAQFTVDDGESYWAVLENGVANQNISNLTAGYHTIQVFYNHEVYVDGKWVSEGYLNTFTVNVGSKTNLTASYVALDYNSTGLVMTLKDENNTPLSGKDIKITLNNKNYTATTNNDGKATLPIEDLPAGNFDALIRFEGSEGYLSSNTTSKVNLNKIATALKADDVVMDYGDKSALVVTLRDANNNPLSAKDIKINLDGKKYTKATDANGHATLDLDLDVAVYTAIIDFAGDDNYNASRILSKITVNKAKSYINASDISIIAGTSNDLTFALTDGNGVGLANKNVLVYINSTNEMTTDKDGKIPLNVNLAEGTYNAFIAFNGDKNYESNMSNFKVSAVKVKTILTASDVTTTYGVPKNLSIALKDAQGVGLLNKVVSISLNGINYTVTTGADGQATLPVNLDAGKYGADIGFAGDKTYLTSAIKAEITVNKVATQIEAPQISTKYNVGKNLVITLESADGQIMAGKEVVVTLNGNAKAQATDSNGQIIISSYNLAPKTYDVDIKFNGDKNYLESGAATKVVVSKASPKITASNKAYKVKTKTKQYTITLKNNKNAVLKNKKVTLKVGGKTYSAKTNSKGKATFKITKLTKKGTYKAVIKRSADSYYKSVSKTVKITVKK